jgi:hypothetical protein
VLVDVWLCSLCSGLLMRVFWSPCCLKALADRSSVMNPFCLPSLLLLQGANLKRVMDEAHGRGGCPPLDVARRIIGLLARQVGLSGKKCRSINGAPRQSQTDSESDRVQCTA